MCAANIRWVKYDVDSVGNGGDGRSAGCRGTRGYSFGIGTVSADGITVGPTTNRLYINIDGFSPAGSYITLYSGSLLDPRFIARDITEKLHNVDTGDERWANATCLWEDGDWVSTTEADNRFRIYSGSLGSSSSVTVATSGTNSAHAILGWDSKKEEGGAAFGGTYSGTITISGTYTGLFDEVYTVFASNEADNGIGTLNEANIVYGGTATTGGMFTGTGDPTYTITIDVTNGTTMGNGTGDVPRMRWTSTDGDDMGAGEYVELLYPLHWYKVGTKGVMIKFTDAVFAAGYFTLPVYETDHTDGGNNHGALGTAQYNYSSNRGDDSAAPVTTSSGGYTALGTRGLQIKFSTSNDLYARDTFYVLCAGPLPGAPANYNITSLNYGNVTVSTDSDVRAVMFEVESGAVELSTVKFGLQNHGTFSHHKEGNADTHFRFGTVGPGHPKTGTEWHQNITYDDLNDDVAPAYLYYIDKSLSVVSTADESKTVGNFGLTADPVWLCIHLGASETGANSTVNYRNYFDYS
jgi:hypothetical protein